MCQRETEINIRHMLYTHTRIKVSPLHSIMGRITTETVLYWIIQAIVIITVIFTICFSLKRSLDSDQIHQRLR